MRGILIVKSEIDLKRKIEVCSKCKTPVDFNNRVGKLFFEKTVLGEDTDIENILYRCKGCGQIVGVFN